MRSDGRLHLVKITSGDDVLCTHRSKMPRLVAGDIVTVEIDQLGTAPSAERANGNIVELTSRKNLLSRPNRRGRARSIVANVDQMILVIATEPVTAPLLIDRFLVTAHTNGISAALVLNKCELIDDASSKRWNELLSAYQTIGYPTLRTSAATGVGMCELGSWLCDRISILVGNSGVGKSSLTARIAGTNDIAIGELSKRLGSGKHTTSTTTLFEISPGTIIVDSPGVRDLATWHLSPGEIAEGFPEIAALHHACQFRDCEHVEEPGCAVRGNDTVSAQRWESYCRLLDEAKRTDE
jgi:ribosome biogenesis GTPase